MIFYFYFTEQYDVLGGVNQISDEGFAPVRSVIGSLEGSAGLLDVRGISSYSDQSTYSVSDSAKDLTSKSSDTYSNKFAGVTGTRDSHFLPPSIRYYFFKKKLKFH